MEMYIGIASKMIIGSIGVFILIRLIGKKAVSELTPFDLLYVLILGALVEESLYDDQVTVLHVIFAIVLWGIIVYLIQKIVEKTERLSSLVEGEPSVLIAKGKLNLKELEENYMDMEQLRTMLRQNGVYAIHEVYYAILEVNGTLTVITKDQNIIPSSLVVEHGSIQQHTLQSIHKDEEWLRTELAKMGYTKLKEIIYSEWDADNEKLMVQTYDHTISQKIYIDD